MPLMPAGLEAYLSSADLARLRQRLGSTEPFVMPFRVRFARPGLEGLVVRCNGQVAWVELVSVVSARCEWS